MISRHGGSHYCLNRWIHTKEAPTRQGFGCVKPSSGYVRVQLIKIWKHNMTWKMSNNIIMITAVVNKNIHKNRIYPSKHDTFNQCWVNVGGSVADGGQTSTQTARAKISNPVYGGLSVISPFSEGSSIIGRCSSLYYPCRWWACLDLYGTPLQGDTRASRAKPPKLRHQS